MILANCIGKSLQINKINHWQHWLAEICCFDGWKLLILFYFSKNQLMVKCWFGFMVWIPGIPLWKGLLLKGTRFESQTTGPQTNNESIAKKIWRQTMDFPGPTPKSFYQSEILLFGGFLRLKINPIYILVNWHGNGTSTLWRCISYWKGGFSIAMLVYQRVQH